MVNACTWMVLVAFWLPAAPDKVDNKEYKAWSDASVGAWCKFKMVTEASGTKTEMEMTHLVVEKTDEKVVLETATVMVIAGAKTELPAQKREIPAKVDKPKGEAEGKKPETKEGDEEIEVGEKKFKCHWVETTTDMEGMKSISKIWHCKDVPGGVVKMEMTSLGKDGAVMSKSTTVLAEHGTK